MSTVKLLSTFRKTLKSSFQEPSSPSLLWYLETFLTIYYSSWHNIPKNCTVKVKLLLHLLMQSFYMPTITIGIIFWLTTRLIPWSEVLANGRVSKLVKKFPAFFKDIVSALWQHLYTGFYTELDKSTYVSTPSMRLYGVRSIIVTFTFLILFYYLLFFKLLVSFKFQKKKLSYSFLMLHQNSAVIKMLLKF